MRPRSPVAIGRRRVGMSAERPEKAHGPFPTTTTLAERGSSVAVLQALRDVPRPATRCGDITTVSCTGDTSSLVCHPQVEKSNFMRDCGPSEWRDPDSNRGHHDFQTDVRNTRTGPEVPANRPILGSCSSAQVSRNLRVDVGRIWTRQGSRVLIDPLPRLERRPAPAASWRSHCSGSARGCSPLPDACCSSIAGASTIGSGRLLFADGAGT
jgi:hypothetical protein